MLLRLGIAAAFAAIAGSAQESNLDRFEKKIRPVLAQRCYGCHSTSAAVPQGGLLLDSVGGIRRGGNSGAVIQPGHPESSLLLRAIHYQDKALKMPPGGVLPPEIIAEFEAWIREGAVLPEDRVPSAKKPSTLWSLTKPAVPPVPSVRAQQWVRNEIYSFILNKLETKGLSPSAEADRRTLIRRASYDLTGLPPSAGEIDTSPGTPRLKLTKVGRPPARVAAIWRALGTPLAGRRALCRFRERFGQLRAALSLVVYLSRLGDPRAQ